MACGHPHLDGGVTSPGVATRWPPDPGAKSSRMVQPRALCLSFPIFQDEAGKIVSLGSRAAGSGATVTVASDRNGVDQSASPGPPTTLIVARIFCSGARLRQANTASCKWGNQSERLLHRLASPASLHRHRSCNRRSSGCPGNSAHPRGGCGSIWLPISTNSRRKSSASRCARR